MSEEPNKEPNNAENEEEGNEAGKVYTSKLKVSWEDEEPHYENLGHELDSISLLDIQVVLLKRNLCLMHQVVHHSAQARLANIKVAVMESEIKKLQKELEHMKASYGPAQEGT